MPLISLPFHHKKLPESLCLGTEDISNVPSDAPRERDDNLGNNLPQRALHPESSRKLRRIISSASIETVRPSSRRGICRRIAEMADNMTLAGSAKKKCLPTQDLPEATTREPVPDSKRLSKRKSMRRGQKSTTRLPDSSHKSGKEDTLGTADRLYGDVPSKQDALSTSLEWVDPFLIYEPSLEGDGLWLDYFSLDEISFGEQGDHEGTFQSAPSSQIDHEDVVLSIQPCKSDVTIWDGLETPHHMFKCKLFLRCTTHSYDSVPLPDIRRIEMKCYTSPTGSRYVQPPTLQCIYEDASSHMASLSNTVADASLGAAIHVGKFWRTTVEGDGRWGWYKNISIPVASRLFDKIEYREFKVVGRVRVGECFVEDELRFGMNMLRREVNMR